jgi:hypothetical protein
MVTTRVQLDALIAMLTDSESGEMDGINITQMSVDYEVGRLTVNVAGEGL